MPGTICKQRSPPIRSIALLRYGCIALQYCIRVLFRVRMAPQISLQVLSPLSQDIIAYEVHSQRAHSPTDHEWWEWSQVSTTRKFGYFLRYGF